MAPWRFSIDLTSVIAEDFLETGGDFRKDPRVDITVLRAEGERGIGAKTVDLGTAQRY